MRLSHLGILLAAVVVWLLLGFDGRLHWDESQYIYTGAYFPIDEIVVGDFQPSGIAGFNTSRIAHVVLAHWMAGFVGVGWQLMAVFIVLHAAFLLVAFGATHLILRELGLPVAGAAVATVTVMFSPIGLYLAGKTLPDISALMWSTLAVLAVIRLVGDGRGWIWLPIGVIGLAMAALTKHVLVWTFVAFAAAALVAGPIWIARARLFAMLVVLSAGSLVLFVLVLLAAGMDLLDFLAFLAVAQKAAAPLAAKALQLAVSLGLLWALLPIAAFHHDRRLKGFFWLWFAIAVVPFLILVPRLEIRYLAPALLPLAGLVFLSFDVLRGRVHVFARQPRSMLLSLMILIAAIGLSSRWLQRLTAHEVEIDSLHTLIERFDESYGPGSYAIVNPWEYSTFLYLRVVYPDLPVYDAFDPRLIDEPQWFSAQERYFEGRVVRNADQLRAIDKPLLYVGFPEAMPLANLRRLAALLPDVVGAPLIQKLDSLPTQKHLTLSWIWDDPALSLEPTDQQVGNYLVYQVNLPETAAQEP